MSADRLKAVAVANWNLHKPRRGNPDTQMIFRTAGYEVFDVPRRPALVDALIVHYFSFDPEPVDELILATTNPDLVPLMRRIKMTRSARIRMWGSVDVLSGTEFADEVIFQPLETLLGIQQTKNVAVYIDFENIAISLNEQGYTVNLDHLIASFKRQARLHGQPVKFAAYAPWGQRGSLPPVVDSSGREVADESPSKLMMANIDPVFNLPGKNSADMRIARDVITDASHSDGADVFIVASGDRDFNDAINALLARNKTVIVWAVKGATSRQLENNPGVLIEYVEDFTDLQTHQQLSLAAMNGNGDIANFTPSQWSSVIIQFDRVTQALGTDSIARNRLIEQLIEINAVISAARGEDLISQAISMGLLYVSADGTGLSLDSNHPVVEKTRLIRDRVVVRVMNTLTVREWEYVNYGFLLKGLAMDRDLDRPGMNYSDQWRSDWIDCLVREHVLLRELLPHRHNPDDLVPVIKLRPDYVVPDQPEFAIEPLVENWQGISMDEMERMEPETADMVARVIVSVEQFTSFRGYVWCPLGSLHKRLSAHDRGMSFQRSVEYLVENGAATISEYSNPQSEFQTKGISLITQSDICRNIISERNAFVRTLLTMYEHNTIISEQGFASLNMDRKFDVSLWFSIMETENILNPIPGRASQYSLFRTHHTVSLVADSGRG
ncbi:MAG: NYN domain-containing protein [Anaerolineae bacterium]|nr:NYN domain-containing protein [Anaerolineae bacterium]